MHWKGTGRRVDMRSPTLDQEILGKCSLSFLLLLLSSSGYGEQETMTVIIRSNLENIQDTERFFWCCT